LTLGAVVIVAAGSLAAEAKERSNPIVRGLGLLVRSIEAGFDGLQGRFDGLEEAEVRRFGELRAVLDDQSLVLQRIEEVCSEGTEPPNEPPPLPDLRISAFEPEFGGCLVHQGQIRLRVSNDGLLDAPPSHLGVLGPGAEPQTYEVPTIYAFIGHVFVWVDAPFCDATECRLLAQADSSSEVIESDESNNVLDHLFGAPCPISEGPI
jgi:hypothetical protein